MSCAPEVDDERRVWRGHIEQHPELKLNEIKIAPQSKKTNEEICVEQTVIQFLDVLYKLKLAETCMIQTAIQIFDIRSKFELAHVYNDGTYTATTEAKQKEKKG